MQRMLAAALAVLAKLQATGIVAAIFLSRVIAFFTLCAGQCDNWADALL